MVTKEQLSEVSDIILMGLVIRHKLKSVEEITFKETREELVELIVECNEITEDEIAADIKDENGLCDQFSDELKDMFEPRRSL